MARAERQQLRTLDAAGQARRDPRSQRPRARVQRRRRHDRRRSRRRSTIPTTSRAQVCARARRLHGRASAQAMAEAARAAASRSPTSRRQVVAGRGAAASRALKLAGHRLHQGEPPLLPEQASWRRTCSATSASTTTGWAASSRPTTRRSAARTARSSSRPTRGATRFSRVERPPTAGAGVELTIDQYLQHIAERELRAGVEENHAAGGTRDHHESADRRDPRAGELSRRSTRTRYRESDDDDAAQPRDPGPLRAGLDVQGRHRVGGAREKADHARRR